MIFQLTTQQNYTLPCALDSKGMHKYYVTYSRQTRSSTQCEMQLAFFPLRELAI